MLFVGFAAVLGIVGAHSEWSGQGGLWGPDAAGSMDGLSIVVPLRINANETRMDDYGGKIELASEDVRVLDSPNFRPGTTVSVFVVVGSAGPPRMAPVGQKCVLLARRVQKDRLEIPLSTSVSGLPDLRIRAKGANEATGLAWFATNRTQLDGVGISPETVTESILSCLDGCSDEGAERVCTYLQNGFYPGFRADRVPTEEFAASKRLLGFEAGRAAYQRAMIAQVRNAWQLRGSDREVQEALAQCATIPTAFPKESAFLSGPQLLTSFDAEGRAVPGPWSQDRWTDLVVGATNHRVLIYWIKALGQVRLDDDHERRIAVRLSDSDPEVRRLMVEHYAGRYGESGGRDLEGSVAYWKGRLSGR